MKKTILFLTAGALALGANAQFIKKMPKALPEQKNEAMVPGAEAVYMPGVNTIHHGKATIAQIGSTVTFPSLTGWTAAQTGGNAAFHWVNSGSNPASFPDLASTSAGDGWILFDFNDNTSNQPVDATLTGTAPYNFTGHAHVGVMISEWHERFQDSVYIDVNNGSGWVSYPIYQNNTLRPNDETDNPFNTLVNVSATAGNQAAVQIRFHIKGDFQGYGWSFDDLKFYDLDPVDVRLQRSAHTYKTGNYEEYALGVIPKTLMTEANPYVFVDNYGYNAQSNVVVNSTITSSPAGGPSYNQNKTLANLAVSGFDSAMSFKTVAPFTPDGTPRIYKNTFTTGSAVDSAKFQVTDTVMLQARPSFTAHGYYLYKPVTTSPAFSYEYTTIFVVPFGKSDTLTTLNLSLYDGANQTVTVQIYTYDPLGDTYNPVASATKTLSASDVSSSQIIWTENFFVADANNNSPVLTGGTNDSFGQAYYVTVKTVNATQEVVLWTADAPAFPATPYFGGQALQDTSFNDASYTLGNGTVYGFTTVPCVKLNFGVPQTSVNVKTVGNNMRIYDVYPNPATNSVNVPFSLTENANVNMIVTNSVGQVVNTQTLNNIQSGVQTTATVPTSGLANGLYFFTLEANGNRSTGRFTVAH